MASLPYPLCHNCQADLVGMARMPYPPTVSSVGCILFPQLAVFCFLRFCVILRLPKIEQI